MFRQNVGVLVWVPALWRGAVTTHSGPREVKTAHPPLLGLPLGDFRGGQSSPVDDHQRFVPVGGE